MEKLIELIIEFQKETGQTTYDLDMYHYDDKLKLIIIGSDVSKGFIDYIDIFRLLFAPGFIKWLVDNDKIDRDKLKEEREDLCDVNLRHLRNKYIDVVSLSYVKLLMLLSIQDNPIEFLIGILK